MTPRRIPVKLTDVAAAAGVAPMTVSRVLNNPAQVAPDTAERVRQAIERLGYVPNLLAGGLSSRRSRIIAAIVPTIESPIFAASLRTFNATMDAAGYHVVLALSGYDPHNEEALLAALLGRRPDGLLLTGHDHTAGTRRHLQGIGVPVVEIWDMTAEPADMVVGFDHYATGAAVAAFFRERGYRRFGVIAADDPRALQRRAGFVAGLPDGGLCLDRCLPAPATMAGGRAMVAELSLPAEPMALYCSSDLSAAGAVIEAGVRGIAVPGQLAVCGFGDLEIGRALHPSISTISVDGAEIGRVAARNLLLRLSGQPAPRVVSVPFQVLPRASTGVVDQAALVSLPS